MYFPFLRGKQFELLAIKEMAHELGRFGSFHPVVEPVKDIRGNGGFARGLQSMASAGVPSTVIINPQVGELAKLESNADVVVRDLRPLLDADRSLRLGLVLSSERQVSQAISAVRRWNVHRNVDLIYTDAVLPIESMMEIESNLDIGLHFLDGKESVRRYRRVFPNPQSVLLRDRFPRKARNQDYVDVRESVFSEDHLFFKDDGYVGFGDYQTVGTYFAEGGSLPKTVAIHLTYLDRIDSAVYIRHFCSDSNNGTTDTAGKFSEAVGKLLKFTAEREIQNPAIDAFRKYHFSGNFPGLGMLKKLSIQNHLYVMARALEVR
jgi:hypothetical protein